MDIVPIVPLGIIIGSAIVLFILHIFDIGENKEVITELHSALRIRHNRKEKIILEIYKDKLFIKRNYTHMYYAIRLNRNIVKEGKKKFNSHGFGKYISGTSGVSIQDNNGRINDFTITEALLLIEMYYGDFGSKLVLIAGNSAKQGNDIGEIVIEDAVVIAELENAH